MNNLESKNLGMVAAGIVLFNPDDYERFKKCVDSILKQVKKIYIYINGRADVELIASEKIVYLGENENKGIAYALNAIMVAAKNDGYKWVLTMDQDSILPEDLIIDFARYFEKEDIAIICPQVIDKRRVYMSCIKKIGEEYVDFCITSASCTSIEAWLKIGGFDEWMFIDLVDNDFCKRLTISGYKILRINKWVLDQQFGKIVPKSPREQQFWVKLSKITGVENIAKFSYRKFVSPMRVYYTCRNIIYLNKKLYKYRNVGYENYNCKNYFGFIFCFILPSILRGQNKLEIIKAVYNGTVDGVRKNVSEWAPNFK